MSGRPNGSFRRVVAALLALALLTLPGAPMRHAWATAPAPQQHMTQHCPTHAETAQAPASVPKQRDCPGDIPGLTCCLSAHCPMLAAVPPPAATSLLPRPGPATRFTAAPRLWLGIESPPALPPPRAA
jgi:hypothetical protein